MFVLLIISGLVCSVFGLVLVVFIYRDESQYQRGIKISVAAFGALLLASGMWTVIHAVQVAVEGFLAAS